MSSKNHTQPMLKVQPPSLKDKLLQGQNSLKDWSAVANDPNLSPKAASVARQMVRSIGAANKIRQNSLKAFPQPEEINQDQQISSNSVPSSPEPTNLSPDLPQDTGRETNEKQQTL